MAPIYGDLSAEYRTLRSTKEGRIPPAEGAPPLWLAPYVRIWDAIGGANSAADFARCARDIGQIRDGTPMSANAAAELERRVARAKSDLGKERKEKESKAERRERSRKEFLRMRMLDDETELVEILVEGTAERNEALRETLAATLELSQLMGDFAGLVSDGGMMLDRIDHNIDNATVQLVGAKENLIAAESAQRGGTFCAILICLVVIVGVLVCVLVLRILMRLI